MKYKLFRDSTGSYKLMCDYFKGDNSRIKAYMPLLKEMFEKVPKKPSNHRILGDLADLVLSFLDKNPLQIEANKSLVEEIVFESLDYPILSIKLENVLEDFLTKYKDKCNFTG